MSRDRWTAVLARNPEADGAFVFAVRTTGVYCRPSCPARRPRPLNVLYFRTPADAEHEGYRACLRCRPSAIRPDAGLLRACEALAAGGGAPAAARAAGRSPAALRRAFRRALGVTPAAYARRLRWERFRDRAPRDGVTRAMLDAGFGSSSRLYERARGQLGMTPAACGKGGEGMDVAFDVFRGPRGRVLIAATPSGLCAVALGDSARGLEIDLRRRFPRARIRRDARLLRFSRARLAKLLDGRARDAGLPLDVRATAFQVRVWAALRAIPAGKTRTYAEIARAVGRPRAVRAVARACASNPVAIVVPCHRVVGADGSLRGYRWGAERKAELLAREARFSDRVSGGGPGSGPGSARPPRSRGSRRA